MTGGDGPHDPLRADPCSEVRRRLEVLRDQMGRAGYDLVLVHANNKLIGNLRYLSGYFPDRAGWVAVSGERTYVFEGAVIAVPARGKPTLLVDPGLTLCQVPCIENVSVGSLASTGADGLNPDRLAAVIAETTTVGRVGIETWDRFPAPLYLALAEALPRVRFEGSTLVEEMRMVKSPVELALLGSAAAAGDAGHQVFLDALRDGVGKSEIDLIRTAEHALRMANPIYEDGCANSPSMIASGSALAGELLHAPQRDKVIRVGDIVHWDICSRHNGYSIDTSRTRIVGEPTALQDRAYDASLVIFDEVVAGAKPGVPAAHLVETASTVARELGFELWGRFVGHGVGLDAHERPDMGMEETPLAEGMTLAIEPRIAVDRYIIGHEDVVVVTAGGGRALNRFPKRPFPT